MNQKWIARYIGLAKHVSEFSEDSSTKVGAYIANPETKRPDSFGYNGLPSGTPDTPDKHLRPVKYFYFEHAERNAIYNSESDLSGLAMFVTHFTCPDCARAIAQKRMATVYISAENDHTSTWASERYSNEMISASLEIMVSAGVNIVSVNDDGEVIRTL